MSADGVLTGAHESPSRIDVPQLRGIAVLGVVVGHSAAAFTRCAHACNACTAAAYVDAYAHAAVPLFLIVSGFAVGARYWDACPVRLFYSRRAARLLPPYIVASLFYMAVLSPYEGPLSPYLVVPGRLLTGSGYYHLWYVVLILQLYLLAPVLLRLGQRLDAAGLLECGVCIAFAVQVGHQLLWPGFLAGVSCGGEGLAAVAGGLIGWRLFPVGLGYFVLGLWLSRRMRLYSGRDRCARLVALGVVVAALTLVVGRLWLQGLAEYGDVHSVQNGGLLIQRVSAETVLHTAAAMFAVVWAGTRGTDGFVVARFVRWVGRMSYRLYLLHAAVLVAAQYGLQSMGLTSCNLSYYVLSITLTLAISCGLSLLLQRLPGVRLVFG
ncbi:MAG: acyltransferase [Dehalococcoidia bacterium]|jgi:peptidoglycan/LPS O-acetylase OafA/YrhL|nr:acyltransferase [Dehalococcoidia bacterium]